MQIKSDLPVHCIKEDIVGQWIFELSTIEQKDSLLSNQCGHKSPDDPKQSFMAMKDQFETDQTITLTLLNNNTIQYDGSDKLFRNPVSQARFLQIEQNIDHSDSTFWTMVYDEGFEMRINKHTFFTFSFYKLTDEEKFETNCAKTLIGWYQNGNSFACIRGHKKQGQNIIKQSEIQDSVVQGQIIKKTDEKLVFNNNNDNSEPVGDGMRTAIIEEKKVEPVVNTTVNVNAVQEPKAAVPEQMGFNSTNESISPDGLRTAIIEEKPKQEPVVDQNTIVLPQKIEAKPVVKVEEFSTDNSESEVTIKTVASSEQNVENLQKKIEEEQQLLKKLKENNQTKQEETLSKSDDSVLEKTQSNNERSEEKESELVTPEQESQRQSYKQQLQKEQSFGYKMYNMFNSVEEMMKSEYYSLFVNNNTAVDQKTKDLKQVFLQVNDNMIKRVNKLTEQQSKVENIKQNILQHKTQIMRFKQQLDNHEKIKESYQNIKQIKSDIENHQNNILRFKQQLQQSHQKDPQSIELIQSKISNLKKDIGNKQMNILRFKEQLMNYDLLKIQFSKIQAIQGRVNKHQQNIMRFKSQLNNIKSSVKQNVTVSANITSQDLSHESSSKVDHEATVEQSNFTKKSYVIPKAEEPSFGAKMFDMFNSVEEFMKSEYYSIFQAQVAEQKKDKKNGQQSFLQVGEQSDSIAQKSGFGLMMKIASQMETVKRLLQKTQEHELNINSLQKKLWRNNDIKQQLNKMKDISSSMTQKQSNIMRFKQKLNQIDTIKQQYKKVVETKANLNKHTNNVFRFKSIVNQQKAIQQQLTKVKQLKINKFATEQKIMRFKQRLDKFDRINKSQDIIDQKNKIIDVKNKIKSDAWKLMRFSQQLDNIHLKNSTYDKEIEKQQERVAQLKKSIENHDNTIKNLQQNMQEDTNSESVSTTAIEKLQGVMTSIKDFISSEYYELFLKKKSAQDDQNLKDDHKYKNAYNWISKSAENNDFKPIQSKLDQQINEKKSIIDQQQSHIKEKEQIISRFKDQLTELKEQAASALHMTSEFKDHQKLANRLNKLYSEGKVTWKSEAYDFFKDMTLEQLNEYAGYYKQKKVVPLTQEQRQVDPKILNQDVSDLDKAFDWEHILKPAFAQGKCGSCFAVQGLRLMEYRLIVHHNITVDLSVQHVLDCSVYNQGCQGGFPYLVGKFAHDLHVVDASCKKYKASTADDQCSKLDCDPSKVKTIYKVEDYWNIGGSYGKCSQRDMMLEIKKNGPILASIDVDPTFMMYKEGVFQSKNEREWLVNGEVRPSWTRVGHTVMCYGWGETADGVKYWLMQNSWGTQWGDNGKFKILRGDHSKSLCTDQIDVASCARDQTCFRVPCPVDLTTDAVARENFMKIYQKW